ncbi:MAG TPA: hypothetical protein VIT00_14555 [Terrimicrobiaceae bacterium]
MDIRLIAEMIFRNEISMGHRRYLVLIALLAGAAVQAGPKDSPVVPPPMAQPQSVSIFRGHSIDVALRAQGRTPGQLKFLIRSFPSKGRLGEIRVTGPKSAEVTYTHDDTSEGSDSFTFAVQTFDSPVSAAAPITIAISEEPPALSVVKYVDFGTLEVGAAREEQIALRNSGGGILEGHIEAPPPWKILGSTEYRLARDQQRKVRILCAPTEQQDYFGKLVFSHDARAAVDLTVSAVSPFEFDPSREIELGSQDTGVLRSGGVVIRNLSSRDRTIEISVPPEVVSPNQVTVPAGSEQRIALHTQQAFLGALEGEMSFESEGFQQSIPIRVFALQPVLRVEPREGLDFGETEPRKRHKGFLRIKNEGGSAARLRATVPREMLVVPDPNSAVLEPGETRVFEVAFEASSTGDYRSEIVIDSAGGKPVSIPVAGRVFSQASEAKKVPTTTLDPAARRSATPQESPQVPSSIPAVKEIRVLKASNRILEFGWSKPTPNPLAWIIQQRQLEPTSSDPPRVIWRDLTNARFFEQDGMVGARFENLAPGQVWFLRVVAVDEQGRRSAPSPTFRMSSVPAKDPTLFWTVVLLLVSAAAVIGFVKFRRNRVAEASEQAQQIARIERR